jgi:hypothetical protein
MALDQYSQLFKGSSKGSRKSSKKQNGSPNISIENAIDTRNTYISIILHQMDEEKTLLLGRLLTSSSRNQKKRLPSSEP